MQVVRSLNENQHTAYLVGGCVRDLMVGLHPKDFDIVTSARPGQIRRIFRNSRAIGRRFRLVHVFWGNQVLEVSTFRAPPEPVSDRKGGKDSANLLISRDNVYGSPRDDANRRDFTLNALFYDLRDDEIIDHVGGLADIKRGIIRSIGRPEIRFQEDPVRMIRALKFQGKLGFELHPDVERSIRKYRNEFKKTAPARDLEELFKILSCGFSREVVELLDEYRFLDFFLDTLLDEIPDPADPDSLFWRMLASLDAADAGRRQVGNVVLLGTMLYPLLDPDGSMVRDGASSPVRDLTGWVYEAVKDSAILSHCSRQNVDHLATILSMLGRLPRLGQPRLKVQSLLRRDCFADALALYRITLDALGMEPSILEEWIDIAVEENVDLSGYFGEYLPDVPPAAPGEFPVRATVVSRSSLGKGRPEGRSSRRDRGPPRGDSNGRSSHRDSGSAPRRERSKRSRGRRAGGHSRRGR